MSTWGKRANAAISQKDQIGTAKTDETTISRLLAGSLVIAEEFSASPAGLSSVLAVPSPAVLKKQDTSIAAFQNPDRWCWPFSAAMNAVEIGSFTTRLHNFTNRGLARNDGEALADKLVFRDRDQDDRRVCLECSHFSGHGARSWRCDNWQAAGITLHSHDAQLPANFVIQLQHCDGFIGGLAWERCIENDL